MKKHTGTQVRTYTSSQYLYDEAVKSFYIVRSLFKGIVPRYGQVFSFKKLKTKGEQSYR
jgi:hypothetical protein